MLGKTSIPLHTKRQVQLIVSNIRKVYLNRDIRILSKSAYKYLYLCSGFIAHYNLNGFIYHYGRNCNFTAYDLIRDIEQNAQWNEWKNFHPGDDAFEYYSQKAKIYKLILKAIA
jgi:hypothetical protein